MYENELYHHGVKGQKWGVRRYQNKDGSLTAEGKKRVKKSVERDIDRTIKYVNKHFRNKNGTLSKKGKEYIINAANNSQKAYDTGRIEYNYNQKHKSSYMAGKIFTGAILGGIAVGNATLAVASGGASLPITALQAGILGSMVADSKRVARGERYATELVKKLENEGYKVSSRPTEYSYTYNGVYKGKRKTRRYNLDGVTAPYKEKYTKTVHYY